MLLQAEERPEVALCEVVLTQEEEVHECSDGIRRECCAPHRCVFSRFLSRKLEEHGVIETGLTGMAWEAFFFSYGPLCVVVVDLGNND